MLVSVLLKIYKSTDRIKWRERTIPSSPIRNKTSFTDTSCFDDQQCLWIALSVAAVVVAFSKHRRCALDGRPWAYGIKQFDSMAIKAYLNQSCLTPQPHVPGSSLAFALSVEDELNQRVNNFSVSP